ncbi:MAG: DUF1048 domain-containing protein [Firmicutes bacterium]|nr:DUF1048 domain-containing protein [Bacillota bacterium]
MNFLDKITGKDMTKELKAFDARVDKLPVNYAKAWEEIKANLWIHSDFSGRNIISILEGVLTMLEETAVDGLSVKEALGEDIKGFCSTLVDDDGSKSFRNIWRKQLNHNIAKKLGK